MTLCPHGHPVPDDASFCTVCGAHTGDADSVLTTQPMGTQAVATQEIGTEVMAEERATEVITAAPERGRFAWPLEHPIWTAAIGILAFVLVLILILSTHPKGRQSTALVGPSGPAASVVPTPPAPSGSPVIETPIPATQPPRTVSSAAPAPAPAAPAPTTGTGATPDRRMQIAEAGVLAARADPKDRTDTFSAAVLVGNPRNQTATNVRVDADFKDSSGRIVMSDTRYISFIGPGQASYVAFAGSVDNGSADPVTVEARATAGGFTARTVPQWTITDLVYQSDPNGSKVKGRYRNPDGAVASAAITCALYSGNRIVSGAVDVESNVPAGASKRFEAAGALPNLNPTAIRCTSDTH